MGPFPSRVPPPGRPERRGRQSADNEYSEAFEFPSGAVMGTDSRMQILRLGERGPAVADVRAALRSLGLLGGDGRPAPAGGVRGPLDTVPLRHTPLEPAPLETAAFD